MNLRNVAVLLALATGLCAYAVPPLVRNPRPLHLDEVVGFSVVGDFAGDAAPDLAIVTGTRHIQVLTNVADGPFAAPVTTPINDYAHSAAGGHFDQDGFLDLAVTVPWNSVKLYLGNGDGTFRAGPTVLTGQGLAGIAVADVNSDGDADVVTVTSSEGVTVHHGDGDGHLGAGINTESLRGTRVMTIELNADAQPDVVVTDDGSLEVGLGLGDGRFAEGFSSWGSGGSAVGDFDHDTTIDLLVPFGNQGQYQLHRGTGDGTYLAPTLHVLFADTAAGSMRAVDVDGDGKLDLIAATQSGPIVVLRGNGNGTFGPPEAWLTDSVGSFHAADFDRDGVMDLVYESWFQQGHRSFLRGTGGGAFDAHRAFDAARATNQGVRVFDLTPADVNGDTHPDLVAVTRTSNGYAADLVVFLNDGAGNWSAPLFTSLAGPNGTTRLFTGDLNGDGKLDAIAGGRVSLGNGDGTFQSLDTGPYAPLFVADFNGDTHLDLVGGAAGGSTIIAGSGTGSFSPLVTIPMTVQAIADFNGDGRLDVAGQGTSSSAPLVGINGPGTVFTISTAHAGLVHDVVTTGDFTGDGHPDILASYQSTHVFPGRGDGTFGDPVVVMTNASLNWLTKTADIDGDGALDLLTSGEILLGTGNGRFRSYAAVLGASGPSAAADFDGDGDPEVVVANGSFVAQVHTFAGPDPVAPVPMTFVGDPPAPRYADRLSYTATLGAPAVRRNGGAVVFSRDGQPVELTVLENALTFLHEETLPMGTHTVAAAFTGDSHHAPVTQTLTHEVQRAYTTIWFFAGARTCAAEVLVRANLVSWYYGDHPGPTGELTFRKGDTVLPSRRVPGSLDYYVSGLGIGSHAITVDYAGDANFEPSTAVVTQVVVAPWTLALNASSSVFAGESDHFATVTGSAPAGVTYTWTVTNGTIVSGQGTRRIQYTAGASGEVTLQVAVSSAGTACATALTATAAIVERQAGGSAFYSITPCRLLDTRSGAPLAHAADASTLVAGSCGIPAGAKSVVANVTVVAPAASGWLSLFPSDLPWPGTSTINYRTGKTRANQAIVPLSADGQLTVRNSGADVHYLIDVTGYFK
ncbi:MAG TPA: FG-GAP-like repeat-containing protein [Thermoanaerobaculia bacterium]|nr:FG-GAP-like repeat-containing protein [Thermoanaerobaculia bacterium]